MTGLDLSQTAVERAKALLEAKKEEKGEQWAGSVEFVCGDFFKLLEEDEGRRFDLIFDYTVCFCRLACRSVSKVVH